MTRATLELARSVPAIPENVAALRHAVTELARRADASERVQGDVALAVGEACGNVVVHAYPPGETGPLILEARVVRDELHVAVGDLGRGVLPRPDSPGLGLGLALMASLAQDLSIQAGEQGRGAEVRMVFALRER